MEAAGPPAVISVDDLISIDGTIRATATDAAGDEVADGTVIEFQMPSGSGTVSPTCVPTKAGKASAQVTLSGASGQVQTSVFAEMNGGPASRCVAGAPSGGGVTAATVTEVVRPGTSPFGGAIQHLPGCVRNVLLRNDDGSTAAVPIGFPVNFFGAAYSSLFVNNNGNVTFAGPLMTYTPAPISSSGLAIIAPFWGDVDTRNLDSAVVTYGPATVDGRHALCVNWDGVGVGYYNQKVDKLNKFQLLLIDRSDVAAGDFDIVLNYDQVQWEASDASGGSGGLGGSPARVGYSNGSTSTFELPGSGVSGAFLDSNLVTGLIHRSQNSLQLGRYVYPVRSGAAQTGGVLQGRVFAGSTATPLSAAFVQACSSGGFCNVTSTGPTGAYSIGGLAAGAYTVRAFPPAGSSLNTGAAGPLTVPASGALTAPDIILTGPTPIPAGTTITSRSTTGGIPVVYWGEPLTLRTTGCTGATASYQLLQNGTAIRSGAMTEGPAGTYTGTIAVLRPTLGNARVVITLQCPTGPPAVIQFDIYIDPSGTVQTVGGAPITGATVTLYRSDSSAGPFSVVPNGSGIMSLANRTNPDATDTVGHFGWDVLAGYYKVRAEKAGCVSPVDPAQPFVESAGLTIPPPVTDLLLILRCDSAPSLVGTPSTPATVGAPYDFGFTVGGSPVPTITKDSGTLPPGLTLSGAGVLSGTPSTPGTYQFVARAANGVAPDVVTGALTIVVNAASTAPTLSGTPTTPATVGVPYNFAFTIGGSPAPTVTKNSGTLPPGVTLSSAGVLAGTPITPGTYTFAVRAANGVTPDALTGSLTIVVNTAPTAPTLRGTPTTPATVGVPYNFAFTVAGSPVPTVTKESGTLPPGLTLSGAGVLAGTPTTQGTYQFVVRAANGVLPNAITPTLTVVVANPSAGATAKALKASARVSLLPFAGESSALARAADQIGKSLEPGLWADDNRLDPRGGARVFGRERRAAQDLTRALRGAPAHCAAVTGLELEYTGDARARVDVFDADGPAQRLAVSDVTAGGGFTIRPGGGRAALPRAVRLLIAGLEVARIPIGCPPALEEGDTFGPFVVTEITTRDDDDPIRRTLSPAARSAALAARKALVDADELLARTALRDAEALVVTNPARRLAVNALLASARREMTAASASGTADGAAEAIGHYMKAWLRAMAAIRVA